MRLDPKTMLALFGALVFVGCGPAYVRSRGTVRAQATVRVAVPSSVQVSAEPPPLEEPVAVRPDAPGPNAVWVEGHYKWQGGWVWTPGHWERDRPGVVWVPPVAERRGGRVVYHPGYWCPVDQSPDPVYARPGGVRVSVRSNATRPGDPRSTGSGTARVRPGTATSGGSARVRPGSATATRGSSGGGSATVRGSSSGSTSTSGGSATVRGRATASGSVRVRVGGGGSSSSSSGGTTRRSASGATTRVRGGGPDTGDDSVSRARPRGTAASTAGGSARVTSGQPSSVQGGSSRVTQGTPSGVQGGSSRVTQGTPSGVQSGSSRVQTRATEVEGGDHTTERTTERPQTRLRCSISTPRAPRNGLITITGLGFTERARVQIGGQFAIMRNQEANRLRVQIPGSSSGGAVRVIDRGQTASCGSIRVR